MTRREFPLRLFLPFALAMALVVGLCGSAIYFAGLRTAYTQQIEDLESLTALVRQWVPAGGTVSPEQRARLAESASLLKTRVTLIDGGGAVLFDTHASAEAMENHNGRPEVVAARRGEVGTSVRESPTLNRPSVYVAQLLDPSRPDGIVLRLSHPRQAQVDWPASVTAVLGGALAAAFLMSACLWLLLRQQWIGPLGQLSETARLMAAGQWSRRAEPGGSDDLREFAGTLNTLAAHAERQLADLSYQRADLLALVDTLPDPIFVCDAKQRVTLINAPAAALLGVRPDQALGQKVVSVITDQEILELFDDAPAEPAEGANSLSPVLRGEGRGEGPSAGGAETESDRAATTSGGPSPPDVRETRRRSVAGVVASAATPSSNGSAAAAALNVSSSPLLRLSKPRHREVHLTRRGQRFIYQAVAVRTAGGGEVLVLRDVTTLAGAVQMKTDFVANASHELRTPIAAIKIAFETLSDVYTEDPEQAERCVQIIAGHMQRLEEMLRDLLDLSRVESTELKPYYRAVKSADVFALVRSSLGPMARQKPVELRTSDTRPVAFHTDERLLNLVLKNLVENSIKFTPPGGSVTVSIDVDGAADGANGRTVVVLVKDTGIGIPPEHIDRVFERFYQVNASRTGSAGRGTGLGLAIVKHAVAALGGTVKLTSEVGKGTTVTCVLPQPAVLIGRDERRTAADE